jgi:hypothetical protein
MMIRLNPCQSFCLIVKYFEKRKKKILDYLVVVKVVRKIRKKKKSFTF